MNFNPDWTALIVAVISWVLGSLGVGPRIATPPRIMNKDQT